MALRGTAAAFTTGLATSVAVTHGISIQSGDVVILEASISNANVGTPTFPSGFSSTLGSTTLGALSIPANAQNACTGYIAAKIAGASEPATYTVTGLSNRWQLVCRVYSGRSATPFTVAAVTTSPVADATVPITLAITGITANAGDDLVLFIPGSGENGGATDDTLTAPSGFGNVRNDTGGSANPFTPMVWSCDKLNVAAGATGSLGGTINGQAGDKTAYGAWLISMATGTPPAPAVVQSTTAVGSTNTVSATLSGVTAGNAVIAILSYYENGSTNNTIAPTPTDTNGTFVVAATPAPTFMVIQGIGSVGTAVWYEANAAAGTHAVTQTNSAGPSYELHLTLLEVSNLGATPAIVAAANSYANPGGPAVQIFPSGVINMNPLFIVGAVAVASSTGVANAGMTTPVGFTNVNSGSNTLSDIAYEHGYQVPSVGGPFQAQWSWSDATTSGIQAMLVGFGNSGLSSNNTGTPLGSLPSPEVHYR